MDTLLVQRKSMDAIGVWIKGTTIVQKKTHQSQEKEFEIINQENKKMSSLSFCLGLVILMSFELGRCLGFEVTTFEIVVVSNCKPLFLPKPNYPLPDIWIIVRNWYLAWILYYWYLDLNLKYYMTKSHIFKIQWGKYHNLWHPTWYLHLISWCSRYPPNTCRYMRMLSTNTMVSCGMVMQWKILLPIHTSFIHPAWWGGGAYWFTLAHLGARPHLKHKSVRILTVGTRLVGASRAPLSFCSCCCCLSHTSLLFVCRCVASWVPNPGKVEAQKQT